MVLGSIRPQHNARAWVWSGLHLVRCGCVWRGVSAESAGCACTRKPV